MTADEVKQIVHEELKREKVKFHDPRLCPCAICDELRKADESK